MKTIILLGLLLGTLSCGKNNSSGSKSLSPYREELRTGALERDYFILMNSHRATLGLPALQYSLSVEGVAAEHSTYMSKGPGRFGHRGWKDRCRRLNEANGSDNCGEIVAMGQKTSQDVLNSWINSPSHRAMIENPDFTHTGVGIRENGRGVVYWTQMFIEKL
jgi:uncharacterized protein YkwD